MKQNGIIIRMGAGKFDVIVRAQDSIRVFDVRHMNRDEEHVFRRELVKQFRISRETPQ